jgi:hypothetical protein
MEYLSLQNPIDLDGKIELQAQDGRFLGLLSSDRHDRNSILNPHTYGSINNINSIYYPHGLYGGEYGRYSPFNRHCLYPPSLVLQQQPLGLVSKNQYLPGGELQIIDTDLLLAIYQNLADRGQSFQTIAAAINLN